MKPRDVARNYDQIAHIWNSDEFPRDNGIAQHERAIAFTDKRGPALDVGCGSSGRLIDLLIQRSFAVEGLDISAKMLELAQRRHPQVTFYHADVCEWEAPHSYAFISAWDSIWHVPLRSQEDVLLRVLRALRPGGVAIFTIGGTEEPSESTNSHMGPPMYHATIGIPRTLELIAEAGSICRHLEYDQYPELHAYVICQHRRGEGA